MLSISERRPICSENTNIKALALGKIEWTGISELQLGRWCVNIRRSCEKTERSGR